MALSTLFEASPTIGSTEYSLVTNSTTLGNDATFGLLMVELDLNALTIADEIEYRIYCKTVSAGTKRLVVGPNSIGGPVSPPIFKIASFDVKYAWDVTLRKVAGTDRVIPYRIDMAS